MTNGRAGQPGVEWAQWEPACGHQMIGFTTLIQGTDDGGTVQLLIFRKKEVDAGIGLPQ